MDEVQHWGLRFQNLAKVLEEFWNSFYRKHSSNPTVVSMVNFVWGVEYGQNFPWVYIDYGFRAPIYRALQWLTVNLGFPIPYQTQFQAPRLQREHTRAIYDVVKTLRKEYLYAWSYILDVMYEGTKFARRQSKRKMPTIKRLSDDLEVLSGLLSKYCGFAQPPHKTDPGAFGDVKGISSELKALYVLVDHNKPVLPLSIMQAPMTPSPIIPGALSGDLYLFEENIIVDVKGERLRNQSELMRALKKSNNLERLYGIRKGVGVVYEENGDECRGIVFKVYVPRRGYGTPLLSLNSVKPPVLLYPLLIERGEFKLPKLKAEDGGEVELELLVLSNREKSNLINKAQVYLFEEVRDKSGKKKIRIKLKSLKIKGRNIQDGRVRVRVEVAKSILDKAILELPHAKEKKRALVLKLTSTAHGESYNVAVPVEVQT